MNSIIFINGSNYFEFRVRIAAGITLLSLLPQTNISIPHTTRQRKMKTNVNGEFKTVWIRLKLNSHSELKLAEKNQSGVESMDHQEP